MRATTIDFNQARNNMVEGQIRPNRITQAALIEAMRTLPREIFVPEDQKPFAYIDQNIPVGDGRVLLSPLTLATLLQAADIREDDSALVIACGTGYLSSIVGKLAGSVIAIDDNPNLTEIAEKNIKDAEILNVSFHNGPLRNGYPKHGPYSLIIIEGAIQMLPEKIAEQLEENGRIITILNENNRSNLVLYRKIGGTISNMPIYSMQAPLISDFTKRQEFKL